MSTPLIAAVHAEITPGAHFELRRTGGGRFEAHGALTFATATRAWQDGRAVLRAEADADPVLEVDCSGITQADSAGLAVLLDWLAGARRANRRLIYRQLPQSLVSIAAISDLKDLLEGGFAP